MHIPWADMQLYLAVADAGSLSAAAKALRVTQPTISRRLAELESELGEPLFVRKVDGTSLTAFGERMLEPARRMAESASDVERVAAGVEASPRGVVRITAPPGVAFEWLAPFAAHARERLPEVRLEVISTVNYLDLARREADLGLRLRRFDGPEAPRDLVILETLEQPVGVYATPEYIARLPRGYGWKDVDWIAWPASLNQMPPNPQLAARIPDFQPAFASDDFLVQWRAAEAGVGAIFLTSSRSRFAAPTSLVPLKLDLGKLTTALQLVCARGSLAIPRVRAVADLLATEMKAMAPGAHRRGAGHRALSSRSPGEK